MKRNLKWIIALAGAIITVLLLRSFVFTSCLIPSAGMENSLFRGERILVNKWSYGLRLPLMSIFSYHRWRERKVGKEDIVVFNNPASTTQPVIDRREVFISRCAGVPGDTLLIDSLFTIVSSQSVAEPDRKRLYTYPKAREEQLDSLLSILSITPNELMGQDSVNNVRSFSRYEYYLLEQAMNGSNWIQPLESDREKQVINPLIIPRKGMAVRVYPWNRTLLRNTLVLHEGKQAEIKNDTLYVDGHPVQHCYFSKDYYWMVSNNSVNLSDSRLFGLVPQDHIIGKASLIWFSKESNTNLFEGYRWNRFFQPVR
ncbi:signal peptidase I [Bacteroides nordii]|uniref:signal peptidase I n=1 Tax=Bacteroides nordii TaxID=291645 RepID=UPI002A807FC8|nr:signal peptidase I [Bacteroides nordii]